MLSGLVLVAAVVVWLSTRPGLSTKARMLGSDLAVNQKMQPPAQPDEAELQQKSNENQDITDRQQTTSLHTVRKGETLSDISYEYYGSANEWQKILNANSHNLKNPNKLKPGTKLIIPRQ